MELEGGAVTRTRQNVLSGRPFADLLELCSLLSLPGFGGWSIGVVNRVRPPATGAAGFGVKVHSPPTTLSRGVILHLHESAVQGKIVSHRILQVEIKMPVKAMSVCYTTAS